MIVTILLGLAGLGLVVLVHELGHFVAAKAVGVEVETFSIGWGPRIAGFTRKGTDWRFSAFPIGGYCKMKGEDAFRKALEEKTETIPRDSGSFYGASPFRRSIIALAGPLANVAFALFVFIIVATVGYTVPTNPNRIVLANEFSLDGEPVPSNLPAASGGLRSGDRIIAANGKRIRDYADLQETIALSAKKILRFEVERDGVPLRIELTAALDKDSGAGRIGIYSWIEPDIEKVTPGSASDIAGLRSGDRLLSVDGKPIRHAIEALSFFADAPERISLGYLRGDQVLESRLVLTWAENGQSNLGLTFRSQPHTVRSDSFFTAIGDGARKTVETFVISIKGIGLLFSGVNVLKAVSGPARITWMVGRTASEGMASGGIAGIVIAVEFLAFLSIGLFIMNLLPIPALDGGMIILFIIEATRRRPLKTTTIYRFQFIGAAFIFALFILSTVSDFIFFSSK